MSVTAPRKRTARKRTLVVGLVAAIGAPALLSLAAQPASAASVDTWDRVAACESTGNWNINTGNGFSGGLQFTPSTWAEFGGTAYAPSADQASKSQQIAIAENVLATQGPGAWPVCSQQAGLAAGGPAPAAPSAAPASAQEAPAPAAAGTGSAASGSYTVASGDTLSGIAAQFGLGWQQLYAANQGAIGADPNSIAPGTVLSLG
ncbi:LysM repeat protein [Streptacidiphilus sp. MAP12-20]|uniref:LysM peptidoglycan-binding domain-containing protein n=1 Tax=Streptacidiphilus sp. MAP12-20 TaxID=3156299 RepID=UPI003517E052